MRQYIRHLGGITWNDHVITYSLYLTSPQTIDADGTIDDAPFDSLTALAQIAGWDQATMNGFTARVQKMAQVRA